MDTMLLREEMDCFAKQHSFHENFVMPDYKGISNRNIASLIGKIFNVNQLISFNFPNNYIDAFNGVEKVILIIADGLGYNRLINHIANHQGALTEIAQKGTLKPLTSVFPATTATALTSIFTSLTPASHQVIGYQMYSKAYGVIFNTLDMSPLYGRVTRIDISEDYAKRICPWMPQLTQHGIKPMAATKGSIVGSGLSKIVYRDQEILAYVLESDMFLRCRKLLEQPNPLFLSVYYSGIDALEHRYGPTSEETSVGIQSLEYNLKKFLLDKLSNEAKEKTLLLITADHGVADVANTVYLKDTPDITDQMLLPPTGDSRAMFLFAKQGQIEKLKGAFEKNISGFKLLPSKELLRQGIFGETHNPEALEVIAGDWTALSQSSNALAYPYFKEDKGRPMLGAHGGLTSEEVVIPLLSARLSKF